MKSSGTTQTSTIRKFVGIVLSLLILAIGILLYMVSGFFDYPKDPLLADIFFSLFSFLVVMTANYFVFRVTWGKKYALKFTTIFLIALLIPIIFLFLAWIKII